MSDVSNQNMADAPEAATTTSSTTTTPTITLIAKWAKERITLTSLSPDTTIGAVKELLCEKTCILPKRQKLVGLTKKTAGGPVGDDILLKDLKVKKTKNNSQKTNGLSPEEKDAIVHEFILVRLSLLSLLLEVVVVGGCRCGAVILSFVLSASCRSVLPQRIQYISSNLTFFFCRKTLTTQPKNKNKK